MKLTRSNQENIEALRSAIRSSQDGRFQRRAQAVRLVYEGYSVEEAAAIADCCTKTVYTSLKKCEEAGIESLYSKKAHKGAKRKLGPEQEAALYETVRTKLPRDVGLAPYVNWTAPLAVRYVFVEFGAEFSERGMRNLFERLGLSYTRPTYTLAKADAQKQADFRQGFEDIKKN